MNLVYIKPSTIPKVPDVPTKEQIDKLQEELAKLPQVEPVTEHYFSMGMYCRKVSRPAGTLVVGRVHKKDHFFMCVSGQMIAWTEKGMKTLSAGDIIESKKGTKRVTYAITDAIGVTVHKTDKTNLDDIEDDLLEPDESSMFNIENKLKNPILNDSLRSLL